MAKTLKMNGNRVHNNNSILPARLVYNDLTSLNRAAMIRILQEGAGERNIEKECRYPLEHDVTNYYDYYLKLGEARKVVSIYPDQAWQMLPDIFETDDLDKETQFEEQWDLMDKRLHVLNHLQTLDEISGIGRFGILLFGFDDGKDFSQPVAAIKPDGTRDNRASDIGINYIRAISEAHVTINKIEQNKNSPRFGKPLTYTVEFADNSLESGVSGEVVTKKDVTIHWTRILHVADNLKDSIIHGIERPRPVFHRLIDIRKILGADGEGCWQGGFPGLAIETQAGIEAAEFDKPATRKEVEKYADTQQRFMLLDGLHANSLAMQVNDPSSHYDTQVKSICISIDVPKRIFEGSEEGKLASSQDMRNWNRKLSKRNEMHTTPKLLRAFFDICFLVGALPKPKKLFIRWPDLNAPTENDRATTASKITEALVKYLQGNVHVIMEPREYLVYVLGFPLAQVDAILKVVKGKMKSNLEKMLKVATTVKIPAGGKPAPKGRSKKPKVTEGAGPAR